MFEYFETMADVGVISRGKILEEAFKESAKALFNLMVNIDTVEKRIKREVKISSEDICSLLYDFLTELLIIMDSEYLIFSDFDIKIYKKENKLKEKEENNKNKNEEEYILKCVAYGEELDKKKHESKKEVKAITYHKMEIKKENGEYVIKYIVDL